MFALSFVSYLTLYVFSEKYISNNFFLEFESTL